MTTRLAQVVIEAQDPSALARFWMETLGWRIVIDAPDEVEIEGDTADIEMLFVAALEPKTSKNPIHFDLAAESVDHQRDTVQRLVGLGARPTDIGQGANVDHVVLSDPEGNEFCVVLRSEFLADAGFLAAVVFEPANPATGRFWSAATGWPIVYDGDDEIALRSPDGRGPFITFGPPGVNKIGRNRVHLDVAPHRGDDHAVDVERLIGLGAKPIGIGQGDVAWVLLADPDGNEFRVLTPR